MQKLLGLVVCGGQSSRMGTDKCMITYYDRPQWQHVYRMLEPLCSDVFISCNKKQVPNFPMPAPALPDDSEFENTGPMAALLSAFKRYPNNSFLLVGCDYPFISKADIEQLIHARHPGTPAVCYWSTEREMVEPLLAIYEADMHARLLDHFANYDFSLRKLLMEAGAVQITPRTKDILISVDTQEESQEAQKILLRKISLQSE